MTKEEDDASSTLRILLDLLSHDINNHIHGSTGYLDLLEQTMPDDPMLKRFLGNATSEIKAISPLVDNIRLLVNMSSEEFNPEEVDLYLTIQGSMETAVYQFEDKELELDMDIKEGETILAADRFLHDVIVQILKNALKNDPEQKVIVNIHCEKKDGTAFISFEDRGKGIPDERKEKILTRFRRSIEEGDVKGKGMGLSVVHEVCLRYGGSARIESRFKEDHKKGTRLVLEIPLAK